jgi:hypothetical protein
LMNSPQDALQHSNDVVRGAMGNRGMGIGIGGLRLPRRQPQAADDGNGGKGGKAKKPITRFNITIFKKAGGYTGKVSVGGPLFGKSKEYVQNDLEDLFPLIERSAMKVFKRDEIQQGYEPATAQAAPTSQLGSGDMVKCAKCGEPVTYTKFCSNCGIQAPERPPARIEREEPETTNCEKCGANVTYEKHCAECGTKAPAKPIVLPTSGAFCGDCGGKVETGKKFCRNCGAVQ